MEFNKTNNDCSFFRKPINQTRRERKKNNNTQTNKWVGLSSILISQFIEFDQKRNILWCGTLTVPYMYIYIRWIEYEAVFWHMKRQAFHEIPMQISIHITYSYSHFPPNLRSIHLYALNCDVLQIFCTRMFMYSTHLPNTSNTKIFERFIVI